LEKTRATSERAALVAGDKLTNSRPAEEVVVEKPKVSVFKTKEQKRREAEERQARSAERKKAGSEVALLEKEIAAMEKRQSEITSELAKPETYADNALFLRLNREHATNESALEKLNEAWAKESERVAAEAKA
jgi:ATP-binding cassette subfamily F protein 3